MDMDPSDLKHVCRICLMVKSEMKSIFTSNLIMDKILQATMIQITRCDAWPEQICSSCEHDLEMALKFRRNLETAEDVLKNFISLDEDAIVESIDEYVEDIVDTTKKEVYQSLRIPKLSKDEKPPVVKGIIKHENPDGTVKTLIRLVRTPINPPRPPSDSKETFICDVCGSVFRRKAALRAHTRRHKAEKSQVCEICKKSFALPVELRRHSRVHSGEKPYPCRHCPKHFSDFGTRVKHERIHTGERPFKCTYCTKTFTYSNVLKFHEMTHTGERNYACSECDKRFIKSHQLKSHLATHGLSSPRKRKPKNPKPIKTLDDDTTVHTVQVVQAVGDPNSLMFYLKK